MAVSETIVREFFELHGFLVRQLRKFVAPNARDEEVDFFVLNPQPSPAGDGVRLPFVLGAQDLPRLAAGVVVVRGGHTETFSPSRLASIPELFRFLEPAVFQQAVRFFGTGPEPTKILVVPALPQTEELRRQSLEFLQARGVDAIIPFETVLGQLIAHVEPNRNYQKSDLLQTLRILKSHGFFRDPQMELFKPRRRRAAGQ